MNKKKSRFVIPSVIRLPRRSAATLRGVNPPLSALSALITVVMIMGVLGFGENARAQEICPEGQITEPCLCNGELHDTGYCCTGIWNQNACRIFHEDCEATNFTEHFMERSYCSSNLSHWNEMKSEIKRSGNSPHSGNYCLTYDPFTDGNPFTAVGYGPATYGNTSNFDLSSINSRYWYFRWYQKWETGISWSGSAQNKLIYINYQDSGDFTFIVHKDGDDNFHIYAKDRATYTLIFNDWLTFSGGSVDDNQWHKLELYIDAGTTGGGNGEYWFKVDDITVKHRTDITFNPTIHSNPINHLPGWPSNISGTPSGTCNTWLDDLEIWDGMPNQTDTTPPSRSNPQPTGTLTSGTTQTTISLTTNETAECKYSTAANTFYADMSNVFATTNSTNHSTNITNLEDGNNYTYYVRCEDTSNNQNTNDFNISFSIASASTTYGILDFAQLVIEWLWTSLFTVDINNDGIVNTRDLGIMMSNWE